MMESYTERQKVYDRLSDNFSQNIRGVDAYYNSVDQKSVELPAGYDDAWCNALGDYIVSEDPNFNPNEHSNQTWHRMGKK
jgi:hypothetical protein